MCISQPIWPKGGKTMLCLALNKFGDREHFQNLAKLYDVINLLTLSL